MSGVIKGWTEALQLMPVGLSRLCAHRSSFLTRESGGAMTSDEKPKRDWHDLAEQLTKATDTEKIVELSRELIEALDKAREDKRVKPTS